MLRTLVYSVTLPATYYLINEVKSMSTTYIVGDVHGCSLELRELLSDVQPDDHVVSVGDLVDKGPDCAGVVQYLRSLQESGVKVTLVRGNHEERHERYRMYEARVASGDIQVNPMERVDEIIEAMRGMTAEDFAFLDTAVPLLRLPEHNVMVVHAGVLPSHKTLPDDWSGYSRSDQKHMSLIYRVRHIDPAGQFVQLGHETAADRYWADLYDGRFGHIYFGHQPFHAVQQYPYATALDLGCVYGRKLAAAVLSADGTVTFRYAEAKAQYAVHTVNKKGDPSG